MYEGVVQDLIDELGRLPGVGPKSAQRIAFHLLQADPTDVRRLADVLIEVKAKVKFCSICFNVSEDEQCRICRDERRDPSTLCVVEEYKDVVAIERTREFRGRYHVLGGAISPIDGIGPDQLHVKELMPRLADGTVHNINADSAAGELCGLNQMVVREPSTIEGSFPTRLQPNRRPGWPDFFTHRRRHCSLPKLRFFPISFFFFKFC